MDVNKIQILNNGLKNKEITIPIELTWDYLGMDQSIDEYEVEIIKQVTGGYGDFEVNRFAHAPILNPDPNSSIPFESTSIEYEFNFYSGGPLDVSANWRNDYISEGFTTQDIYYYENNFSNSFFKLDLYDNVDEKRQTNYITIIIPTQQGLTIDVTMNRTPVKIKRPYFILDYVGDKEGFFIYWLKKRNFLDITTFYMSAKFYDASKGTFTKMINVPQSDIVGNKYVFDNTKYFYYRVQMDYDKQTYQVFNMNNSQLYGGLNQRAGTTAKTPIKWYEYVNP
jgi:hypothetical protein